jgi:hypothetical protein
MVNKRSSMVNKRSSMDNKTSSIIAKSTKKISSSELLISSSELLKFLEYLYTKRLLNSSKYDLNKYDLINEYLNKEKIQPPLPLVAAPVAAPLPPLPPLQPVTTIKEEEEEEEDSREDREKFGEPFEPTEEQKRNLERSSQTQTSRPRTNVTNLTNVTEEHMEQAKVFDQNNNIEILKNEIRINNSNLETLTLKTTLPNDVTFKNNELLYSGNNTAKRSLIEKFNNSNKNKYKSVSESELKSVSESELKLILSNNLNYLSDLNQLLNNLKEPPSDKSGGKPVKYKSTGITVFILYKNKKYNRTIYVKDKGKTKYCKIKNEYILLSKLKVI